MIIFYLLQDGGNLIGAQKPKKTIKYAAEEPSLLFQNCQSQYHSCFYTTKQYLN